MKQKTDYGAKTERSIVAIGGSLALIIPKTFCVMLNWRLGDRTKVRLYKTAKGYEIRIASLPYGTHRFEEPDYG